MIKINIQEIVIRNFIPLNSYKISTEKRASFLTKICIKYIIKKNEKRGIFMEKVKVLLYVYAAINLGDNLFVYTLLKRYPEVDFYIQVEDKAYQKIYDEFSNIHFLNEPRNVGIVNVKDYDAIIYVGGSIFMESEYAFHEMKEFNYLINQGIGQGKPFFYMSSNFGPYKTQEYLEKARENFAISKVCFRDKESYELFQDLETVSYAPDLAFSLKIPKVEKEKKTIGISVINLENRDNLKDKTQIYEELIKKTIIQFAKRNYQVKLFSFSQFETDDKAIERIQKSVPKEYQEKVTARYFDGDIDSYLEDYAKMEYMICTRFHSMILSILSEQKIYNITYSKKQDNVILDTGLFRRYQRIKDLEPNTKVRKFYFKKPSKRKVKKIIIESQKQFENLENVIRQKAEKSNNRKDEK